MPLNKNFNYAGPKPSRLDWLILAGMLMVFCYGLFAMVKEESVERERAKASAPGVQTFNCVPQQDGAFRCTPESKRD